MKVKCAKISEMEESIFSQEKFWKEVLDSSGILTQVKFLMRDLPVNVAQRLASQTLLGPKKNVHAENASI